MIKDEDIDIISNELKLDFDECRRNILKENSKSINVQACPGSGKTTLLAVKLILLAKRWNKNDSGICVLSHTNVAKNEIIERLKKSVDGQKLLKAPHFIGTIQEFTNRFLAIPIMKSLGLCIKFIDDDIAVKAILSELNYNTKNWLDQRNNTSIIDMQIEKITESSIEFNMLGLKDPEKSTYKYLKKARLNNICNGFFFYDDMYKFANFLLAQYPIVKSFLQNRFSRVFIDEMQDTDKQQDVLINNIFSNNIIVERYGDINQAIFSRNKEKNETFNSLKVEKFNHCINKSNRFDSICKYVTEICPLGIELSPTDFRRRYPTRSLLKQGKKEFEHSIIIYREPSELVLETFGSIVQENFNKTDRLKINAIGHTAKKN